MKWSIRSGAVLKKAVYCWTCQESFLFTLDSIAQSEELRCPLCHGAIGLTEPRYSDLVRKAKATVSSLNE